MKVRTKLLGLALTIVLASPLAEAASRRYTVGPVLVSNVWARTSTTNNTAAYMNLSIQGANTSDRLIKAECADCARTELHTHKVNPITGVASMRPVKSFSFKTGEHKALRPMGDHIMLMGLKKPAKDQTIYNIDLYFEKAGKVTVQAVAIPKEKGMSYDELDKAKASKKS